MEAIKWYAGNLSLLDQTKLPAEVTYIQCSSWQTVAKSIKKLSVRGAPAIGVAAAFGIVVGAKEVSDNNLALTKEKLYFIADELKATRPTAVNLFWAIDRMLKVIKDFNGTSNNLVNQLETEAVKIFEEDKCLNNRIAEYGASLFIKPSTILTHCNAGALATSAYGTALGVIRRAWEQNKINHVYADETRPLLQGARLTAWELMQDNIPVTLITDNMAGWVMKQGKIDAVIVGADRIALNGDVANKIGTYSVALLAKAHNIPFYVAAPSTTFDFSIADGTMIPIEEREKDEVRFIQNVMTAPRDVDVYNPAFDVTPNNLISAIITEHGVLKAPYSQSISLLLIK